MKRIVRLTESDLTRIVRRVISEQGFTGALLKNVVGTTSEKTGSAAFQLIKKGIYGAGTNQGFIQKGVDMIKTQADYNACLAILKKSEGWSTIMRFIATDMDYDFDTQSAGDTNNGQGFSFFDSNPKLDEWSNHLRKFNNNEIPQSGY